MLSSSLDALLKLSKVTSPQKLFDYDCITLYSLVGPKLSSLVEGFSRHEQDRSFKTYIMFLCWPRRFKLLFRRKSIDKLCYFLPRNIHEFGKVKILKYLKKEKKLF